MNTFRPDVATETRVREYIRKELPLVMGTLHDMIEAGVGHVEELGSKCTRSEIENMFRNELLKRLEDSI